MATKILWSWSAPAGAPPDTYNLYRGTAPGSETLYQSGLTATQYTDTAVTNGSIYYGYITSVKSGLESTRSNEANVTVSIQYPPPPPNAPVFITTGSIFLTIAAQALPVAVYDPGGAFGDNPFALPSLPISPSSPATSMNVQYGTDPTFTLGVTTMVNVSTISSIAITGLLQNTLYYVRFVAVNAVGTTPGLYGNQQTRGMTQMAVENASVLNGQQLFVEATPGVSGAATVRLLLTQLSPDEVPDKKAYAQEGVKFPVDVTEGKEYTTIKYNGNMGYMDMAYLCATTLVKPVITTPANNGVWNITGVTGTLGFTFNGITLAPATYASVAAIQAALGSMSSIGPGNVIVTGTAIAPIVQFIGSLSTTVLPLTLAGTPTPGIALGASATLTRRWTFLIDPLNPDVLQTYTLEKGVLGQAGMGEQISSIFGTSMQFTVSKAEQKISGDMVGQLDNDPFTMTTLTSTANVTSVPITAKQVSVFLGDNAQNIARLTRTQQIEFQLGDRVKPIFTLDDSVPSFAAVVEGALTAMAKLTMLHNTQSQAVLVAMRANAQKWLIYEALGPLIESGFKYRFKITMPVKVMNTQKQDVEGARSAVYDFQPIYSPVLGGASGGAILVELDVPISVLG